MELPAKSLIKVSEVKAAEYNPRKISEKDYNNLKKSVKTFGILRPLIINKNTGNLISGHQLLKVLTDEGIEETDAIFLDLTIEQEKALNLAMNKISGEFEEDKLIEILQQIDESNQDLLGHTGFGTEEINYLLGLKEKDKEKIFAKSAEDTFKLENKHGIKFGDIVKLDEHYIICGDSRDPDNLRKLIGDKKIDLVVTSPPYNVGKDYSAYNDNQDWKDYFEMMEKIFSNIKDFINKARYLCINVGKESGPINLMAEYHFIFKKLGYHFFRNIYWLKPEGSGKPTYTFRNPFPRMYSPSLRTEFIQIYSADELPKEFNNLITYKIGAMQDDARSTEKRKDEKIPNILLSKFSGNVWEMQPETHLWADKGISHPAPFPTQLPFNCIRFFSFEGERILDPFCGSGTTIIACDQLNRKGLGIELDPNYVSVAIERFLMYKPNAKLEIQRAVDPAEKVI
jgi:DNA modification methylase